MKIWDWIALFLVGKGDTILSGELAMDAHGTSGGPVANDFTGEPLEDVLVEENVLAGDVEE